MLRASERRWLKTLVRKPTAQQRQVTRARIVLLAAAGWTNAGIARKLEIAPNTAAKWRKRYVQQGVEGLADRKRPGRPRRFPLGGGGGGQGDRLRVAHHPWCPARPLEP